MSWDSVWDKVFQEQEWGKYPGESLIRFVARNFYNKDRKNIRLLEVGCGPGANVWYMAREGFRAYGMDGSATAIQKAKRRLKAEGLKARLVTGDINHLPYPKHYFDAVIDNECLAHNPRKNTEKILKEIQRVLKPNGLLYSRTFTSQVYIGLTQKKIGPLEYTHVSDGPFANRGFVRLMDKKGIKELYGQFFKIFSMDRLEYTQNNQEMKISEWIITGQVQ